MMAPEAGHAQPDAERTGGLVTTLGGIAAGGCATGLPGGVGVVAGGLVTGRLVVGGAVTTRGGWLGRGVAVGVGEDVTGGRAVLAAVGPDSRMRCPG